MIVARAAISVGRRLAQQGGGPVALPLIVPVPSPPILPIPGSATPTPPAPPVPMKGKPSDWESDFAPFVRRLPPIYQEALELCVHQELSYQVAFAVAKTPPCLTANAMKTRVCRAKQELAKIKATRSRWFMVLKNVTPVAVFSTARPGAPHSWDCGPLRCRLVQDDSPGFLFVLETADLSGDGVLTRFALVEGDGHTERTVGWVVPFRDPERREIVTASARLDATVVLSQPCGVQVQFVSPNPLVAPDLAELCAAFRSTASEADRRAWLDWCDHEIAAGRLAARAKQQLAEA